MKKIDPMKARDLENIFVIGDVHGCYYTLVKLLKKLPPNAIPIFVGDLCDKGNHSKDVIELVMQNNYQCVKGNHEYLFERYMLDAVEKDIQTAWSSDKRYGGVACIQSYNNDLTLIKKHLQWIQNLPFYLEIENYFITHGFGLEEYDNRDNQEFHKYFLLNRYYPDDAYKKSDVINVFGHCAFDEVIQKEDFFCIDTSCSYGKQLTALQLGTHDIIQETMDPRDSDFNPITLTSENYDVAEEDFESIASLVIDKASQYGKYDLISNEILENIVIKYGEKGKEELLRMHERAQILPKQLRKVLGDTYLKENAAHLITY